MEILLHIDTHREKLRSPASAHGRYADAGDLSIASCGSVTGLMYHNPLLPSIISTRGVLRRHGVPRRSGARVWVGVEAQRGASEDGGGVRPPLCRLFSGMGMG